MKVKIKHQAVKMDKKITDVSKETGINKVTLYNLANGRLENISLIHLKKLCKYFKCSTNDLIDIDYREEN